MSRILLYIVHKYNRRELSREAYQVAHILMTEARRRVNDDPEFYEQMELDLQDHPRLSEFTDLIPLPNEKKYQEVGPIR